MPRLPTRLGPPIPHGDFARSGWNFCAPTAPLPFGVRKLALNLARKCRAFGAQGLRLFLSRPHGRVYALPALRAFFTGSGQPWPMS
jgi:hypothetical protein